MSRRGAPLHGASDVASTDTVVEQLSSVFTLAPGHPLRRQRCLICAEMVGARPVKAAVTIDFRSRGCRCGSVPSVAFLICADHDAGGDLNIADPALARYYQHHQWGKP